MHQPAKSSQALAVIGVAALLAVSACSGGSSGPKPKTVTKAAGQAIAAKINLSSADLAGYTGSAANESAEEKAQDATLDKCTGVTPESKSPLDVKSDNFDKGSTEVSSEVQLQATSKLVQHDLAAINTSHARQCIATQLKPILKAISGVTAVTITMAPLTEPTSGTDGSFGLHALINVTAGGKQQKLSETEIGFARGNAEFTLTFENAGASAPQSQLATLRGTLIRRADANMPAGGLTIS
jgi:hypothetical protein